jgi:hypothetical protein
MLYHLIDVQPEIDLVLSRRTAEHVLVQIANELARVIAAVGKEFIRSGNV